MVVRHLAFVSIVASILLASSVRADQPISSTQESLNKATSNDGVASKDTNSEKNLSSSKLNDSCADSVYVALVAEAKKHFGDKHYSDQEMLDYINNNLSQERTNLLSEYGCNKNTRHVANDGTVGELLNAATQTTAQIAAGAAVKNVNQDVANGGDAFTSGYKHQGNATITAGSTQAIAGATQIALGIRELVKIKKQENSNADKIEAMNIDGSVDQADTCESEYVDGSGKITCKQRQITSVAGEFAGDAKKGADLQANAIQRHRDLAAQADAVGTSLIAMGAMNAANGAQNISNGIQMKQVGENLLMPVNPLVPYAGNPVEGTPPPTWVAPNVQYGQVSAAQDGGLQPVPDEGAPYRMGDPDSGHTASGGLEDPAMYSDVPYANIGGGGGGGGLGGGGLGGGGSSGNNGGGAGDEEYVSPNQKFDRTGGGGNMAQFGGGAGKNRMNNTGDFNINALLEKFLPKKDEKNDEKGAQGLSFNNGAGRTPSSIEEDGSILGPNSNLFARVSTAMTDNYKKGNLK